MYYSTIWYVYCTIIYPPVLKSDNANGLFGFRGACDPETAESEDVVFRCPIERQRGDTGTVLLTWKIVQVAPSSGLAVDDFVNTTGVMVFEPGEREKVLERSKMIGQSHE